MKTWQEYSKREKRDVWRARFELNGTTYRPKAHTKKELLEIVAELRLQANREQTNKKHGTNLDVTVYIPTLFELFEKILPTIKNEKQKTFAERVFNKFLDVTPPQLKVTELKIYHFQQYINLRRAQVNKQTKRVPEPQTVNKELYAVSSALKNAALYFTELENWTRPNIPFLVESDSVRELNLELTDFARLLAELRKDKVSKQTKFTELHRKRIADDLEFRSETGLRRKEVVRLQKKQYFPAEKLLKNVRRWKTGTVTKIFPLTNRAAEIIEQRIKLSETDYIFTADGEPVESDYRTIKNLCEDLSIPYGRFTDGGFVPHDLRHKVATEIVRLTDIKTAQEYLAHSNIAQTSEYLHTTPKRLFDAVSKLNGTDVKKQLGELFDEIKQGKIEKKEFIEKVKNILTAF